MALVYQEESVQCWNEKKFVEETTLRCSFCRALFPIEYTDCPNCNMLK